MRRTASVLPAWILIALTSADGVFARQMCAPAGPAKDGTLNALTEIADQGLLASRTFDYLTDDIGARVTGSPAM